MKDSDFLKKIALGTVQFGLPYGISNRAGQSNFEEVCQILKTAASLGINTLDTASAYGNSEEVLGKAMAASGTCFQIVTKVSGKEEDLNKTLAKSLQKLGTGQVHGCLFQDYAAYQVQPEMLEELQQLKAAGKISKIGFSLYYPWQAEELLKKNTKFDLVQVPYNLFDRRFETVFDKLKKLGVEIHTRSAFLQGLFFLEPENTGPFFREVQPAIVAIKQLASQERIPLSLLLLGFAALNPFIDKVVIGVENASQLTENAAFADYISQLEKLYPELQQFAQENEEILLPFNWKI